MNSTHNGFNNVDQQPKDIKKHSTAVTSRESFTIINNSGQRLREKIKVLEAIEANQPVTSRMLSIITGIERTNITRSLFDLVHDSPAQVKEAYIDKCSHTQRRVNYYTLINWPQISLFNPL